MILPAKRTFSIKTVRAIHLTEPKDKLAELHREFIHQYAPQTFQAAQSTYDSAHAFIAQEPRNETRILEHVAATEFAISHARHIGKDVHFLEAHDVVDYERYLLTFERNLNRIRQSLEMDELSAALEKTEEELVQDEEELLEEEVLKIHPQSFFVNANKK